MICWFVRLCKSLGFRSCCWAQSHGHDQNVHAGHEQTESTYLSVSSLMRVHHLSVPHFFFPFLWSGDDGVAYMVPDKSNEHFVNTGRKRDGQDIAMVMAGCFPSLPPPEVCLALSPSSSALSFPFCTYWLYQTHSRYTQLFIKHKCCSQPGSHSKSVQDRSGVQMSWKKRPLSEHMNFVPFLPYCWLTSCSLSHFFTGVSFSVKNKTITKD